jgi:hypothetical protein
VAREEAEGSHGDDSAKISRLTAMNRGCSRLAWQENKRVELPLAARTRRTLAPSIWLSPPSAQLLIPPSIHIFIPNSPSRPSPFPSRRRGTTNLRLHTLRLPLSLSSTRSPQTRSSFPPRSPQKSITSTIDVPTYPYPVVEWANPSPRAITQPRPPTRLPFLGPPPPRPVPKRAGHHRQLTEVKVDSAGAW